MYSDELLALFKKKGISIGDGISVKAEGMSITGSLMPRTDVGNADTLVIKLDSGYNMGINKDGIDSISLLHPAPPADATERPPAKKNAKLPTISILHTGGTIASKVDYRTGGVISRFSPEDLLEMFPDIKKIANVKSRLLTNMWSQDMRFSHYNLMAREIDKEIKDGAEGIILSQGTDTIHYTAAALSFILEDLPVPVIIVGAQRSSDRGSTDANLNLVNAAYFIANSDFAEVGICMHETINDEDCWILPGTKSRKMHTSRRDAFRPINAKPWARVNYRIGKLSIVSQGYRKKRDSKLKLSPFKEDIKVALIKQHTNMLAEQFSCYQGYDGLVIEATGLGCLPISEIDEMTKESGRILKAISDLVKSGVVVVEAPETIYGRINMNVYEDQRVACSIGVLGHLNDMTPETTFIKLAWLLSNYKKEEVKKLITKNFRGETSPRSEYDTFLI
jgi:glutamyl-tRNA(Gln) amidotransferase subunit D